MSSQKGCDRTSSFESATLKEPYDFQGYKSTIGLIFVKRAHTHSQMSPVIHDEIAPKGSSEKGPVAL